MKKTVWIIHPYATTPAVSFGGRHYYLAEELAKRGYNVYVIAGTANHQTRTIPKFKALFTLEKIGGFSFIWVKMPEYANAHSKQRAINWFLFPWRIQKLSQFIPDKPDVVLCSSPHPIAFLGAERIAKKFKAKLVFEVRDIWPLTLIELGGYSPKHPFIRFMQWVEERAYKKSDRVISNLKNSVEHMVRHGLQREKFAWVPNGFSMDEVNQNVPLNETVANSLPKNKFIVGYAGAIGVANTLDTFVEAAEKLKSYSDIAFVMVGQGSEKEALQNLVSNRKLDNVIFIEPIPKVEIQSMLSRFDVCFIGLTKDPLFKFGVSPNKLFDYLYSGKPILYAIESGEYTPVKDADAGVQVEPQNPQALADAVLQLYSLSNADRDKLGANGKQVAIEQYEYGMLAEKLEKVLFDN